jgi:hypothetical protein
MLTPQHNGGSAAADHARSRIRRAEPYSARRAEELRNIFRPAYALSHVMARELMCSKTPNPHFRSLNWMIVAVTAACTESAKIVDAIDIPNEALNGCPSLRINHSVRQRDTVRMPSHKSTDRFVALFLGSGGCGIQSMHHSACRRSVLYGGVSLSLRRRESPECCQCQLRDLENASRLTAVAVLCSSNLM